ncbi:hypothetical protein SBRY_40749 [Actinacidiphila bryophytorum]|uniref:Uncharacterized protein n=1 Tax=Actinacidiphila bryophytorum TaxID=1436133 RepID=A0A9W4H3Q4_9ACTN|nr:hypothetical protein SBRY_40749 [Actinacidiphila bryophytorum]
MVPGRVRRPRRAHRGEAGRLRGGHALLLRPLGRGGPRPPRPGPPAEHRGRRPLRRGRRLHPRGHPRGTRRLRLPRRAADRRVRPEQPTRHDPRGGRPLPRRHRHRPALRRPLPLARRPVRLHRGDRGLPRRREVTAGAGRKSRFAPHRAPSRVER